MRRIIAMPLILALLALSACTGAESYAPTPVSTATPTPIPTAIVTPSPTPMPTPEPLPPYHPDVGFDIASTWTAEFGDGGFAILELGEASHGQIPYGLFWYQYVTKQGSPWEYRQIYQACFSGSAVRQGAEETYTLTDGISAEFTINADTLSMRYRSVAPVSGNGVTIYDLSSDTPSYTYNYEDYYASGPIELSQVFYLPAAFTRLSDVEADLIWYSMPLFGQEVMLPFEIWTTPEELDAIFGPPPLFTEQYQDGRTFADWDYGDKFIRAEKHRFALNEIQYLIYAFESTDPDCIPRIRGIQLGDSLQTVLSRLYSSVGDYAYIKTHFPCSPNEAGDALIGILDDNTIAELYLYGDWCPHARLVYDGSQITALFLNTSSDRYAGISFVFDENEVLISLGYDNLTAN